MTFWRVRASTLTLALLATGTAYGQTNEGLGVPARPPAAQIEAAKLSKLPRQTRFVEADYPAAAATQGIEAEVGLLLDIDAQGKVQQVAVAQPASAVGMGFDEAAIAAAQQFEFEPAEQDGKPIAVQLSYRYKFKLTPRTAAPATPDGGPPAATPAPAPPPPAPKPQVNFSGQLRERGTRLPMSGVVVTVFRDQDGKPVGFEASSDAEGRFRFFDLAPGEWKVLIEAPGYYPFRTTETIVAGERIEVTYHVERGSYNPFDVTVTAIRPRKEVSRTVISAKEIDKVPGTAGDPLAVVQNFAGVARAPVNGLLVVRGSAPEDTLVFVDGATVPLIYHFGGLRSVIPVGMLDSIEFYPGNFAPYYGRATGGIIDVQIKKLQPKKIGGYADVSILDTGLYLEVPLGDKGAIALAGRRSYVDVILNAVVPSDSGVNLITAPRYYDYQILANYRPAPAHDLRAMFFGSDDRLKLLFTNPAEIDPALATGDFGTSSTFYRTLLTYRYVPGDRFENTFRLSQGRNWVNFNAGQQLKFEFNVYTSQVRDSIRQKLSEHFTLGYGADIQFTRTDILVKLPLPPKEGQPMGDFDPSKTLTEEIHGLDEWMPGFFVEGEIKLGGLLLLPGLRFDYFQQVHQAAVQPRLTGRWQLGQNFTAKGGVGLFVEEPQPDETDKVFGNPDLELERALHYSAGLEWKPRPYLTFDLTGFYKDLSHQVSPTEATVPDENGVPRPVRYDNTGTGRVYGLEIGVRHEFSNNFSGWLAYTLSRAERRDSGAGVSRLFDFDQPQILTLVGTYLLPRNWQIGARFRLVSGNPLTPVLASVFNASRDQYQAVYGATNSARNGTFHQLDLRIDKRWIYQSWMLGAYLDIQNIYNRANPEGLVYNFDFTQTKTQQGLPILPILGIRAEF
jgi:TonB family protein